MKEAIVLFGVRKGRCEYKIFSHLFKTLKNWQENLPKTTFFITNSSNHWTNDHIWAKYFQTAPPNNSGQPDHLPFFSPRWYGF
jgi:hypothetical protein